MSLCGTFQRLKISDGQKYMREMIESRKNAEVKEARYDLFSSLLDANEDYDDVSKLTSEELLGALLVVCFGLNVTDKRTQETSSSS